MASALKPAFLQLVYDAVGAVLGAGEHQGARDALVGQHRVQKILLLRVLDVDHRLLHALGGGRRRSH